MILDSKHWSKSKTIRFNLLIAALAAGCQNIELLRSVLPDWGYLLLTMAVAVVNIWLRTVTVVPLSGRRHD